MSDIVKVAATGIIAAVCAIAVRKQVPELSILLVVCAGILILVYCFDAYTAAEEFMDQLADLGGLAPWVVAPVIKVTGIAIVTRIAADLCKDANENTLSTLILLPCHICCKALSEIHRLSCLQKLGRSICVS